MTEDLFLGFILPGLKEFSEKLGKDDDKEYNQVLKALEAYEE